MGGGKGERGGCVRKEGRWGGGGMEDEENDGYTPFICALNILIRIGKIERGKKRKRKEGED